MACWAGDVPMSNESLFSGSGNTDAVYVPSDVIKSHLPFAVTSSSYGVAVHVHHAVVTLMPLTVKVDFSWGDTIIKPLVTAMQHELMWLLEGRQRYIPRIETPSGKAFPTLLNPFPWSSDGV